MSASTIDRRTHDRPATPEEALVRVRAVRPALAALGPGIDADGTDAGAGMALLAETGAQGLSVPAEYGGLLAGGRWSNHATVLEAWIDVAAADGSVGQMWGFQAVAAAQVLTDTAFPDAVRATVAHEVLHEGRRLGRSMSERGTTRPTTSRTVDGGILLSGTKSFGTNTGGGGRDLVVVPHLLDGSTPHEAMVRLDAPGVELTHDWDTMGQRGTDSQTIHFDDVLVPDGWHHRVDGMDPAFMVAAMTGHAALLQGIGEGALTAAVSYLREFDRASMPMFASPADDPIMHRALGEMSASLAPSRALVLELGRAIGDGITDTAAAAALMVRALQADHAATRAALHVTSGLFDLTGARSTTAARRLDRFWRNARTMATHHSKEATSAYVSAYLMNGALPPLSDYIRL